VNLESQLPTLLPLSCKWAEEQAMLIQQTGRVLTAVERALAVRVGVRRPAEVRVAVVSRIPAPTHELLRSACEELGFLGPDTAGLTLDCGIYIKKAHEYERDLLAHELRHVAQYEEHGSIRAYLSVYIPELLRCGYANAPMELDACRAAQGGV
jgi:hypothetical protein